MSKATPLAAVAAPSLRYTFRGGSLKTGSIVLLKDVPDRGAVPVSAIFAALKADARLDVERFAISFYSKPGDDDGGWVLLDDAAATPEAPGGLFDLTTTARLDLMLEDRSAVSWTSTWSQRNDNPDDGPEGYFGIGIYKGKGKANEGTLWRSAYQAGAAFIFSIGARFERLSTDTTKTWVNVPALSYADFNAFAANAPFGAPWVAVEIGGQPLEEFDHPTRAVYILGSEDTGLPSSLLKACPFHITLPAVREASFNVAVAGSIVMYDRLAKQNKKKELGRPVPAPSPEN